MAHSRRGRARSADDHRPGPAPPLHRQLHPGGAQILAQAAVDLGHARTGSQQQQVDLGALVGAAQPDAVS